MILYLTSQQHTNLLDFLTEQTDALPIKKMTGNFMLKQFVIYDMRNFSHCTELVLDRDAFGDDDIHFAEAIEEFLTMYNARITVICEGLQESAPLCHDLLEAGVGNIVTAEEIGAIQNEIRQSLSGQGMTRCKPKERTKPQEKEKLYQFATEGVRITMVSSQSRIGTTTMALGLTIAQESTQTSIVSEALGNSENNSNLSSADKQQMFAPYEQYGLIYDATQDILLYNDKIVRWFEDYYPIDDNGVGGIDFLNESGTVDVYAVRDLDSYEKSTGGSFDSIGTLVGLKEFSQDEFNARNIDSLRENASIAVTGNPLENSEIEKFVAEYEEFGITYDFTADQWYFNGEEVRYFWDVLISNGESLTSGKFNGELRTLGNGNGIVDIYTIRDYDRLNSEGYGTLTGIEKYSQEEFDEHTHTGIPENQSSGTATK